MCVKELDKILNPNFFIIAYDLAQPDTKRDPAPQYESLSEAIANLGGACRVQKSVWFLASESCESVSEVYGSLSSCLNEGDTLFVSVLSREIDGELSRKTKAWLAKYDRQLQGEISFL